MPRRTKARPKKEPRVVKPKTVDPKTVEPNKSERLLAKALEQHQTGLLQEAEQGYHKVLEANPHHFHANQLLGTLFVQTRRYELAVTSLQQAIRIDPGFAAAHNNLRNALKAQQRPGEAEISYRQSLVLDPNLVEAHNNLGHALMQQNRPADAEASYRTAVRLRPDSAEAHNNLGAALNAQNRLDAAGASYRHALSLKPGHAKAHNNLGNTLQAQGQLAEAESSYLQATLKPDYTEAHINLGHTYQEQHNLEQAEASYLKALSLKPDFAQARVNLSYLWLLQGKYLEGWPEYEWRFQTDTADAIYPATTSQNWDGKLDPGQIIYVQAEQGIGDEIMFASCVPDLLKTAAPFVFECTDRLVPLFERSFRTVRVFPKLQTPGAGPLEKGNHKPVSIGSLPRLFRQHLHKFPGTGAYLKADLLRTGKLRQTYQGNSDKPVIGLSWRGGRTEATRQSRSIELANWDGLLRTAKAGSAANFVSLQYGEVEDEIKQLPPDQFVHYDPSVDPLTDLDTFAAQVAACDLVISVDNTTVHMAGALGIPTWVILSTTAEWRWLLNREDSPWYPSLRLFRQRSRGDWTGLLAQVTASLETYLAATGTVPTTSSMTSSASSSEVSPAISVNTSSTCSPSNGARSSGTDSAN